MDKLALVIAQALRYEDMVAQREAGLFFASLPATVAPPSVRVWTAYETYLAFGFHYIGTVFCTSNASIASNVGRWGSGARLRPLSAVDYSPTSMTASGAVRRILAERI